MQNLFFFKLLFIHVFIFFKVPWLFDVVRSGKRTADDEELCCLFEVEPAFLCLVAVGGFQQICIT